MSSGPTSPIREDERARVGALLLCTCGSQSHACIAGRKKINANGFVARTSNETIPSPSSATVAPASCSSAPTGRRGTSRCRATSQPSEADERRARSARAPASRLTRQQPGSAGAATPDGQAPNARNARNARPRKSQNASRLRRLRAAGSERRSAAAGSARTGRRRRPGTGSRARRARARSPSRGRCGRRPRRSSSFPARARGPGRASRCSSWVARPSPVSRARVERGGAVGERGGRPLAGGRQRDGRNAARDERPLLVEGEREAEVDQLLQRGPARRAAPPVCSRTRFAAVSTSEAAGERGLSPVITMRGGPRPAIASRLIVATTWNGECSAKRSAPSPPKEPAVGREKDDRVRGAHALAGRGCRPARSRARARPARRCRSRRRSRRARCPCRRGAPSRRSRRTDWPCATAHRLRSRTRPRPGTCRVPRVRRDGQAVRRELVAEPLFGAQGSRPAGHAVRKVRSRARSPAAGSPAPSKFGGRSGAGQRARPRDAEREDQERQREDQERAAVQPSVDRPFERAAAWRGDGVRGSGPSP